MSKHKQKVWEKRRKQHKDRECDHRTPFDIDMARIIHSAAFRRLQGKTQILGLGDSDFYRTRLTHSIEVAQIASGIIRHLTNSESKKNKYPKELLPETPLITAISLAHDIGHPPFGHGGEIALNFMMRNHGGFEGNAQTLRLVHLLEPRSKEGGLNLTRRTLLGLMKYPAKYTDVCSNQEKKDTSPNNAALSFTDIKLDNWVPPKCYYDEEQLLFDWIFKPVNLADRELFSKTKLNLDLLGHKKTCYKSLDTSIMDIADDIAYGVHDLEDAISMRLISKEDFEKEAIEYFNNIDSKWIMEHLLSEKLPKRKTASQDPLTKITAKLFGSSWERKDIIGAMVHTLITNVEWNEICEFKEPLFRYNIYISKNGPAHELLHFLKRCVSQRVIKSATIQTLEYRGLCMIAELFQAFQANPCRLLPEKTRKKIESRGISLERGIADHIAGMTDEYATKMYERLFIPRRGTAYQTI